MPATVKAPPSRPRKAPAEVAEFREQFEPPAGHSAVVELPVALIVPSPTNPRSHFDPEALESLAASIKAVGVMQPILVRRASHVAGQVNGADGRPLTYELIAGERRYRASKLARRETIPARIVDVTDEEALDLQARENLDREDLNPIERALTFRQILDKCGLTQEALAKRYRVSQAEVSNAVRLLELPEAWQQYVARGQLSPTHARELLPWCDLPKVLELMAPPSDEIAGGSGDVDFGSVANFKNELQLALRNASRSMAPPSWDGDSNGCRFKASKPEDVAALEIRNVPVWGGGTEKRAFNVDEWNARQKAAKKRAAEKAPKEAKASRPAGGAEDEWKLNRWLRSIWRYKQEWLKARLRVVIRERINCQLLTPEERLAITKAAIWDWNEPAHTSATINAFGFEKRRHDCEGPMWAKFQKLDAAGLEQLLEAVLFEMLAPDDVDGYGPLISALVVESLARQFDVRLDRDWRPELEFFELFDAEERKTYLLGGLADPKAFVAAGDLSAAAFLDAWPKLPRVWIPPVLQHVDEKGKLTLPSKKPSGKSKGSKLSSQPGD